MPAPKNEVKASISPQEIENIILFFRNNGLSFTDWAKERDYKPYLVFNILYKKRKCIRGKSFQVAKQLKEFCFQQEEKEEEL